MYNTLPIQQQIKKNEHYVYDHPGMRAVFEDHIPWLLSRAAVHPVEGYDAQRFHNDLSAYLQHKQIPLGLHWLYMRLNGMYFNWEFTENTQYLMAPKDDDVRDIIDQYMLLISK